MCWKLQDIERSRCENKAEGGTKIGLCWTRKGLSCATSYPLFSSSVKRDRSSSWKLKNPVCFQRMTLLWLTICQCGYAKNRVSVRGKEKASEVSLIFFSGIQFELPLCGQLLHHNCLLFVIKATDSVYIQNILTLLIFLMVGSIKPEHLVEIPDLLTDASCNLKMSSSLK